MAMSLERWRPGMGMMRGARPGDLGRMQQEMEDLLERLWSDWPWPRWAGPLRGTGPAVDMMETPAEVVLRADLPGLERRDMEVHVEDGMLTIRGERKEEQQVKDGDYYCSERWTGAFSRTLALPPGVDGEKVRATFKNGVLELRLPKSKEAKGHRIDIKVE